MPLRIKCPTGHVMIVPDNRVGRELRCPRCDQAFIVPEVNKRQAVQAGQVLTAPAASSTGDTGVSAPATTPSIHPADDASRRLFVPSSRTKPVVQLPKVREAVAPPVEPVKRPASKNKPPRKRTFPPRSGAAESIPATSPTNPLGSVSPVQAIAVAPPAPATPEPIAIAVAQAPFEPPATLAGVTIATSTIVASPLTPPAPVLVEFVLPAEMPTVAVNDRPVAKPVAAEAPAPVRVPAAASDSPPTADVVAAAATAPVLPPAKTPAAPISLAPPKPPISVRPAVAALPPAPLPPVVLLPQPRPTPSTPVRVAALVTVAAPAIAPLRRASATCRPVAVQLLVAAAMFAAIVSMVPAVADIIEFVRTPHTAYVARWALVLLMLGVVQFAYGIYLLQLPDWSAVWVVTLESLALAAMYAMVAGLTLISAADGVVVSAFQLHDQLAERRATLWCLALCFLFLALAFFAGRTAVRWRKREQVLHGVGGLLPRI